MYQPINLIGQRFDKLTVIDRAFMTKSGAFWDCVCVCGNHILKLTTQLRRLNAASKTGCRSCERQSRSDTQTVHGGAKYGKSYLYRIWKGMRNRCSSPGATSWKYYGAKGISICSQWDDFAAFREWSHANGFQVGLSIERKNPHLNYTPENCEWITRSENSRRAGLARGQASQDIAVNA